MHSALRGTTDWKSLVSGHGVRQAAEGEELRGTAACLKAPSRCHQPPASAGYPGTGSPSSVVMASGRQQEEKSCGALRRA
ncbi:hypothetical protein NDU88_000485 [Pleurodeles waltl]|uniref:Uncharacterized protein n=1 Tax=Pleurodeles waltl TaxID=8319 RepID=A0AAV7P2N8_PLEWA|nr:hypothetical protein NDU88_000485 [Pleurodeles waltl]